jgi:hypothetical protein
VLKKMTVARILRALDFGLMMNIAYPMRRDEREAVATFLGTNDSETGTPPTAFCHAHQPMPSASPEHGWNRCSLTPAKLQSKFPPSGRQSGRRQRAAITDGLELVLRRDVDPVHQLLLRRGPRLSGLHGVPRLHAGHEMVQHMTMK